MTTEEYLGQLKNIDYRIKYLMQSAKEWYEIATSIGGNAMSEKVQTSKRYDKMGDAVAQAVSFENEAEKKIKGIIALKNKIESQIEGLDDFRHTIILREYYVNDLHLDEIAYKLDLSMTTINREKRKAVSEFENLYLNEYKNAKL